MICCCRVLSDLQACLSWPDRFHRQRTSLRPPYVSVALLTCIVTSDVKVLRVDDQPISMVT